MEFVFIPVLQRVLNSKSVTVHGHIDTLTMAGQVVMILVYFVESR